MAGATGGHLPYPAGWLAAPDTKPGDDTGEVSRVALNAAIADAENLIEADYTADSWIAFEKALADAKAVSDKAAATQTEVSDALACILLAKDALTEKPADSTDPGTNPDTDPGTNPGTDPGTNPGTDPGTDPGTNPGADPGTDPGTDPGENPAAPPNETALNGVLQYIAKTVTNPVYGNEWNVLALARAGVKNDAWNAAYLSSLGKVAADTVVSTKDGVAKVVLSGNKYTENERVILALTALGLDASKVNLGGVTYDFVSALTDKKGDGSYAAVKQGINGAIYALIALDSKDYLQNDAGKAARAYYLKYLEDSEIAGGGWALIGTAPDPDITAMVLQAIAPYYRLGEQGYDALSLGNIAAQGIAETLDAFKSPGDMEVADPAQVGALDAAEIPTLALPQAPAYSAIKSAVERAVAKLSELQSTQDGGFSSWGSANSESVSQVLTALAALGYDGTQDGSFIKSVAEYLLTYQDVSGGFTHTLGGSVNGMATEQAAYALVAYARYLSGERTLYDIDTAYDWVFAYTPPTVNPGDNPNAKPGESDNNGNNVIDGDASGSNGGNTSGTNDGNTSGGNGDNGDNARSNNDNTSGTNDNNASGDNTAISHATQSAGRSASTQRNVNATLASQDAEKTTDAAITPTRAENIPLEDSYVEKPKIPDISGDAPASDDGADFPFRMIIGIVTALIAVVLATILIVLDRRKLKKAA
jgi:hypothetical protein